MSEPAATDYRWPAIPNTAEREQILTPSPPIQVELPLAHDEHAALRDRGHENG